MHFAGKTLTDGESVVVYKPPTDAFSYIGEAFTHDYFPTSRSAAGQLLHAKDGEPDGSVRIVWLDFEEVTDPYNVDGPADGTPLLIFVKSGLGKLNIRSGRVIVHSDSSSGNPVYAYGAAEVTVIARPRRKITTIAHDTSSVTIVPMEGSRGVQATQGADARLTILDQETVHHEVTVVHID